MWVLFLVSVNGLKPFVFKEKGNTCALGEGYVCNTRSNDRCAHILHTIYAVNL